MDAIGFHFYVHPQPPEALWPLIERVKQILRDNGAGDKQIWCTELGWAEPKPFPSEELAAGYLARSFILSWASGVHRLYWYAWDNHNWVSIETTQADNQTLRPAGDRRMRRFSVGWWSGRPWTRATSLATTPGLVSCTLEASRNGLFWNTDTSKSFTVPASWRITNIDFLLRETPATPQCHNRNRSDTRVADPRANVLNHLLTCLPHLGK